MIDQLEDLKYSDGNHTYRLDKKLIDGISTVCKVGQAADSLIPWAYYSGTDDAFEFLQPRLKDTVLEEFRLALKQEGYTPFRRRDAGGIKGTVVHDVLEKLAQDETHPNLADYDDAARGHVQSLLEWHTEYKPTFLAVEVMVCSRTHRFAGRYDVRAEIDGKSCLIDLKTSKRIYPEQHFVQLAGYELASVEMGYPATDAQYVLCTDGDGGKAEFVKSTATAENFLNYLNAHRDRKTLKKGSK